MTHSSVAAAERVGLGARPSHHLAPDLLWDYVSGHLPEAVGLAVATHLTLCPECRAELGRLEATVGAIAEQLAPLNLAGKSLESLLARLDDASAEPARPAPPDEPGVPRPLAEYLPGPLDGLAWRRVLRGLHEYRLPLATEAGMASLFRIAPDRAIPRHTHRGSELTLVLRGSFDDDAGHFGPGDLALADAMVEHQPTGGQGEDCIALVVTDAPLRLTGRFGRLLNPFLRR